MKNKYKNKSLLLEYKNAMDKSVIVSKTDNHGIIIFANPPFCKLSGYTEKELLGSNHNIIRHPDMPSSTFKSMWKTLKKGKQWTGIIKNKNKDNCSYYVQTSITPIFDTNGEIKEYIAIRTDITEREQYKEILEENLNASNNNLEYLAQYEKAISDYVSVIKTDANNTIIYANDNFCKISGFKRDELLTHNCSILRDEKHIKNNDCSKILTKLRNREPVNMVFSNRTKNNKLYYMDTKIYPLIVGEDLVENLYLMHDVTSIKDTNLVLEETQKDIIYKLGEIGEMRSKETGNHVKRVAYYSRLLADLYGLNSEDVNLLFLIAPIHDIGKVGIPDNILNKEGKLTNAERATMKAHSEIGYNLLKNSSQYILKTASIVAYQHHERWDGKGYPRGLNGKNIHIYGRIVALADVYDALSCKRVYKVAWTDEKIENFIKDERGLHFDPDLVDLFLKNINLFKEIKYKYQDMY